MIKEYQRMLLDKNVMVGVEFEFITPQILKRHKKMMKKWSAISVAYYEYELYDKEFEKYNDGKSKKKPKIPKYARELGYKDGDIIPDPDEVMKKPKGNFLKLVDGYLYIGNWPMQNPFVTANATYKKKNRWIVKPDYSIGDDGFEIVSPIMSLKDCLEMLPKMFKCIDKYGNTTKDCGIHFNISLDNIEDLNDVIDPTKLTMFIDEDFIYKRFPKRKNNEYAESMMKDLKNNIKIHKKIFSSYGHYMAVNFEHLKKKNKYVEFRYLGGTKYHKRLKDIKTILGMFIYALKMSVSKKKEKEYSQKLDKIIGDTTYGVLC